jgi:CubicO group peptidase (beta-lactamase class C family)
MSVRSPRLHLELSHDSLAFPSRVRDQLTSELLTTIEESFPAGFNIAVVTKSSTLFRAWGGFSNTVEPVIETARDTMYDLASLTKVVSTTTLTLWLVQNKRWKLSDPVARWLPGFPRDDLTIEQLLTHTSGLIPHRPFFHLGRNPPAIRRAVYAETEHGGATGEVLYSDLNFMLLGWAVARCANVPLDRLFDDVVAGPLGLTETRYRPPARYRSRIAATERNGDQRLSKQLVWGDVHDGNAWALGGVAGHAGLFAPTDNLIRFVQSFLGARGARVLSAASLASISRHPTGTQPTVRGLGWRLDPAAWGPWPPDTLWHNGFTGTSLLISPSVNLGVVLMTNAIHPIRQLERQDKLRATIHATVATCLAA